MSKDIILQNGNDVSEQKLTIHEATHEWNMSLTNLSEAEKILIEIIERHLGFSLNDDDASKKLSELSDTIQIPNILYQYVT